jgi:hypothetical protein
MKNDGAYCIRPDTSSLEIPCSIFVIFFRNTNDRLFMISIVFFIYFFTNCFCPGFCIARFYECDLSISKIVFCKINSIIKPNIDHFRAENRYRFIQYSCRFFQSTNRLFSNTKSFFKFTCMFLKNTIRYCKETYKLFEITNSFFKKTCMFFLNTNRFF